MKFPRNTLHQSFLRRIASRKKHSKIISFWNAWKIKANKRVVDTAHALQRWDGGGVEPDSYFEKSSEVPDLEPSPDHEIIHDNDEYDYGNRTRCNDDARRCHIHRKIENETGWVEIDENTRKSSPAGEETHYDYYRIWPRGAQRIAARWKLSSNNAATAASDGGRTTASLWRQFRRRAAIRAKSESTDAALWGEQRKCKWIL